MNLRIYKRADGTEVLQYFEKYEYCTMGAKSPEWLNVPVHKEPEAPKKPREFDLYVAPDDQIKVTEVPKGYKLISMDKLLLEMKDCGIPIETRMLIAKELGFGNE